MYLYNSLSHKKEEFIPNHPDIVKMYTCGPTVYHFAHIGNLRSYIMEDVLEKALRYEGYPVKRVMNITDVGHLASDADTGEDKMLKGARREHKSVMEIAKFYTDAFFADCEKLHIKRPDVVEPATNCIGEYIKIVESLLEKGYAYQAGGNVYFDTSKLSQYYVFNDHKEEDLAVGVREGVEEDTNKRNKERLCPLVHQVQIRRPGTEVGFPLGRRLYRLAYRVHRHLHQASGGGPGYPLRRHRQRLPASYKRDRPVRELSGAQVVQLLVPCAASEYERWKNVQVQGRISDSFPAGIQGL